MPIFAENMAFYIFWAGIVWVGMKKWGRLSLLDTCYSKNKYELSLVSTPNEIEHTKYYKIDDNNYLQLRIINDTDFNK